MMATHDVELVAAWADRVVLLGDGEVKVALTIQLHRISKSAREKIEAAGGKVELIEKPTGPSAAESSEG